MQFGQPKDLVVRVTPPQDSTKKNWLTATVTYMTPNSGLRGGKSTEVKSGESLNDFEMADIAHQCVRLSLVDALQKAMNGFKLTKLDEIRGKRLPLDETSEMLHKLAKEIERVENEFVDD